MKKKLILAVTIIFCGRCAFAIDKEAAEAFVGDALSLQAKSVSTWQEGVEHVLVFEDGFVMEIGGSVVSADTAVVWLKSVRTQVAGRSRYDYSARAYLEGGIDQRLVKGGRGASIAQEKVEDGKVYRFEVTGEVFVTAENRIAEDISETEFYQKAKSAAADTGPRFVVQRGAVVPPWHKTVRGGGEGAAPFDAEVGDFGDGLFGQKKAEKQGKSKYVESKVAVVKKRPADSKLKFRYPVKIMPAGEKPLELESGKAGDGSSIATIRQRFYISQKQDEKGRMLELEADSAVVFYSSGNGSDKSSSVAGGRVKAVYVAGDVILTEGPRTTRAAEMYYDFENSRALVLDAEMRTFDLKRNVPVYLRAEKLKRLAEHKFYAENVTLTSSEFYKPQVSATVSSILVMDTTDVDALDGEVADTSYEAQMRDVRLKLGERTLFRWPYMRSNMMNPDMPIKRAHVGSDSTWGTSLETQWYLSRLLGLREPEGVDSTFALDYYSKRGVGAGISIDYENDDSYGNVISYLIKDSGEDRLGRNDTRKDIEAGNDYRGRFGWLHRQFLPDKWQVTTGVNYLSDQNFLEQYYRNEFNVGGAPETYAHFKHTDENRSLSILAKGRINDFADELDELPTVEYHMTGESIFDDEFTLYSDTQVSRLRQRIGDRHTTQIDEDMFGFVSHRTEIDRPFKLDSMNLVPYAAGIYGYDDRSGFTRTLVDGSNAGRYGDSSVFTGEFGVRAFGNPWWKVYPDVRNRLWDIEKIRHIITPHTTAAVFCESDSVVEQRNAIQLGLSQRLQTKRGPAGDKRTVDWMRLDTDFVFVENPDSADNTGPDYFIWNQPIVPMRVFSAPEIFSGDLTSNLHRFEMYGPRRNYFATDYIWRISDTSAVLSDMYFDLQSSVVSQYNIGYSRLVWPDLSYYVGSRYLRRINVLDEKGSNAVTFAATYILDPRYTLVFAQQFDFDYSANIRSDITLIRRYHRMFFSVTYSADASLDDQAIVFSIWPQGVPELALGPRRYVNMGGTAGY